MLLSLNTLFIGKNFLYFEEIASTNTQMLALLEEKPIEGTVIFADRQTQGRGQAGTHWDAADAENLTFSFVLYPTFLSLSDVFYLSKMLAVALHKALSKLLFSQKVQIKWANDIWVFGKKIAGILIENQLEGQHLRACVIGIGINVNQVLFPENIAKKATSFALETEREWDREAVLKEVLVAIEKEYLALKQGKYAELDYYYLSNLLGYQENRYFRVQGEKKEGYVVGVEKSGRLVVSFGEKVERFDIKEIEWM